MNNFDDGMMPGAENVTAMNAHMKHEEDVQKFIEGHDMPAHEVALYILAHGSANQKVSMLQHLSRTLKGTDARFIAKIIQELNERMLSEDSDVQSTAPAALTSVLSMLGGEANHLLLLQGAKIMLEVKAVSVRREWSALTLELAGVLPQAALVKEVVPLALKKSQHGEPQDQRELCTELIGKLCGRLDQDQIVSLILDKALALCQDTEVAIRVAMCGQLNEVARAIGLELTKEKITQELLELLVDEEKRVSQAAFTALIDLVEFFDEPYRREHVYPIIKSYISNPPEDVLSLLIEEFGRFLWKIKTDIQCHDDVLIFVNFFRHSSQKSDVEVRRLCAYNLPAVVASLPSSVYGSHINSVTKMMCVDPHAPVRRAVAAGFHELCGLLGEKAAVFVKDSFLALLCDSSVEVKTLLVKHLNTTLDIFAQQLKNEDKDAFFAALVQPLVNYELAIQKDWRNVQSFFSAFPSFPNYFPPNVIHEKFIPILTRHLFSGAHAVKHQCSQTIIDFAHGMLSSSMLLVVDIFSKLTADFGRSSTCFHRMTFVTIFVHTAQLFSRRFLRERLLETLLDLHKDSVSNVRRRLCSVLPDVRRILPRNQLVNNGPNDAEHNGWYMSATNKLAQDADPDVRNAMAEAQMEIDELEKEFARQVALRITNTPADLEDKKREDREGNVIEVAKEQEKVERRQKLRELLKDRDTEAHESSGRAGPRRPVGTSSKIPSRANSGSHTTLPQIPTRQAGPSGIGSGRRPVGKPSTSSVRR